MFTGRPHILIAVTLLGLCVPAHAEWMDWSTTVGVSVVGDDNVSIASRGRDKLSDEFLSLQGRVGRRYVLPWGKHSGALLGIEGDLARREYNEYDGLSGWRGGARLSYLHKLGLGPTAAQFGLHASAHYDEPDDRYREHWDYQMLAAGAFPLDPRWTVRLRALALRRSGVDWASDTPQISSDIFDQTRWELGAQLRYRLHARVRVHASADYMEGEFDTFCGPNNPERLNGLAELPEVKALAVDRVFNSCRWLLDGDGWRYQGGIELALAPRQALQLSWREHDIRIDTGQSYERTEIRLDWRYVL